MGEGKSERANLKVLIDKLIESLGDPVDKNEYLISADKNGKWWIEHVYVGSAEPLEQWITNNTNND